MEQPESKHEPYQPLGEKLRGMREQAKESLADVSGAVEIDVQQLTSIEHGQERPSEDILLLLISHFNVKEDEAMQLWEMAGYEHISNRTHSLMNDDGGHPQPAVMVLPIDARVVYSDMVHVMVNNYGVIMNFMQGAGPNNQSLAIARIGMSKEHAQSVLEVLQKTLEQHEAAKTDKKPNSRKPKASRPKRVATEKTSRPDKSETTKKSTSKKSKPSDQLDKQ
jgi:transcriptional regulator with XRE-family HTH domain